MYQTFTFKKTAKIKREEMESINAGTEAQFEPSLRTVSNILNYSKALSIRKASGISPMRHYEMILN